MKKNAPRRAKLLVGIISKSDEHRYTEAVNSCCTALTFSGIATGTASLNYLSYLGLNEIEKRAVFSLIPDYCEKSVLAAVGRELRLYLVGRGIAFTLPLTAISGVIEDAILSTPEKETAEKNQKNSRKEKETMHELVIAVVNQKFTDTAIDAARAAGATGATVFHTKSVGNAPAEQKIGTTFRQETDTVFILTSDEYRQRIMEAVRDSAGLKTDGGAVLFSLPVDELVGIGRFREKGEDDPSEM